MKKLWEAFKKWIDRHMSLRVELSPEINIFNRYAGQHKQLINMYILTMKYYIYCSKCFNKELAFIEFVTKIIQMYNIKKLAIVLEKDKVRFHKKWNLFEKFM